jgi:enoyl-CoA hydratase/carnithine racemase
MFDVHVTGVIGHLHHTFSIYSHLDMEHNPGPEIALYQQACLVSAGIARELALTAREFRGQEAKDLKLVSLFLHPMQMTPS